MNKYGYATKGDRLYNIYSLIKSRCYNPHNHAYKDYGARGITVCDEWLHDFVAFREWALSNGYEDGLTIDRIDNDKGYSPENCRWVTMKEQCNNRRSNKIITYNGESHNIMEWSKILNINPKTIYTRISRGWSNEDALTNWKD